MNRKKMNVAHAFLLLVVTVDMFLSTFSVSAMQDEACSSYDESTAQTSHGGSIQAAIMELRLKQEAEAAFHFCPCCSWSTNEEVASLYLEIYQEMCKHGLSKEDYEDLCVYEKQLKATQVHQTRMRLASVFTGQAVIGMGGLIACMVGLAVNVNGGWPFWAFGIGGGCLVSSCIEGESIDKDSRECHCFRNDALDSLLKQGKELSDASTQEKPKGKQQMYNLEPGQCTMKHDLGDTQ